MWSEVNARVNYPIKAVLVEMVERGQLNMDDNLHLFCASWLSTRVSFVGIELFVKSWNHHPIPGNFPFIMSLLHNYDSREEEGYDECSCSVPFGA